MIILPVTLSTAAAAAVINIWLGMRIGRLRHATGISVGDGGNDLLLRRMRAQLNFAENTPLVLVMLAALELANMGNPWLLAVGGVYSLGRVLHGVGMDGGALGWGRMIGTLTTMLTQLGLAVWGVLIVWGL